MSATAFGVRTRRPTGVGAWAVLCVLALLAIVVWPSACDAAASVAVAAKAGRPVVDTVTDLERRSFEAPRSAVESIVPDGGAPGVSIHHIASAAPIRVSGPSLRLVAAMLVALLALLSTVPGARSVGQRPVRRWASLHASLRAPGRAPPAR